MVWASQTGTAEEFAATCVEQFNGAGIAARPRGAEEVAVADLTGTLLFVVSTTGDGDPPDNGIALWNALAAAEPGDLDDLRFSVLGFGDSSYADFCGFARKLDARLEYLGATRIVDRALCEPDFEATAQAWTGQVTAALSDRDPDPVASKPSAQQSYSRTSPLRTAIISNSRCAVRDRIRTSAASVSGCHRERWSTTRVMPWACGPTTRPSPSMSSSNSPAWTAALRSLSASRRCPLPMLFTGDWISPASRRTCCGSCTNGVQPTTCTPRSTTHPASPNGFGGDKLSTC